MSQNRHATTSQSAGPNVADVNLQHRVRHGANIFYWIAALSLFSSPVAFYEGSPNFTLGLGVTFADLVIADHLIILIPGAASVIAIIGIGIYLCNAGVFVLFGLMAARHRRWAFITGMILYGLDALLVLAIKDTIGFTIHIIFLYFLVSGLWALGKLRNGNL